MSVASFPDFPVSLLVILASAAASGTAVTAWFAWNKARNLAQQAVIKRDTKPELLNKAS
jgi:uncharacterized protein involved in outer membrane biogenesis